jgi:5,6-dimethylbenzimidazole synthase
VDEAPPSFDPAFRAELEALLVWRRDVRHFRSDPIAEDDLAALLALARIAPSVGHSQPWRYVRVRSADLRGWLADHVDEEAARAGDAIADPARRAAYDALKLHGLREAPEILAVFCDEATPAGWGLGAATMPEARAFSVVMSIHTLWLAARARGIGIGWVSILDPVRVTARIDVPEAWRLIALLCLGLPTEPSAIPELERRGWQARIDGRDTISVR